MYKPRFSRRSIRRPRRELAHIERPRFPLSVLDGDQAIVSNCDDTGKVAHLSYSGEASANFMAQRIPIYAFKSGVIISVGDSEHGLYVFIDHRNGCMTQYDGLVETAVKHCGRQRRLVKTGDVIGYIASSRATLRFTMFEATLRDVPGFPIAVDPRTILCFTEAQWLWSSAQLSRVA